MASDDRIRSSQHPLRLNTLKSWNLPGIAGLIFIAGMLLAGCAVNKGVNQRMRQYVVSITSPQTLPSVGQHPPSWEQGNPPVFTFMQACDRAAEFDERISRAMADANLLQIDLKQANTLAWPRLDLKTYFQIPLVPGNANWDDIRIFNGGAFLRYDIEKLLFSADASAVARARIEEKRESIQMERQRVFRELFALLLDRESLKNEIVLRRQVQSDALRALESAQILVQAGRMKVENVSEYEGRYQTCISSYREAVRRFDSVNRLLSSRLFLNSTQEVVITDFAEILASLGSLVPREKLDEDFYRVAWERRHDAKMAEIELFLKEMAVIDARRRRFPKISASLGVGSLSLSSSLRQPPFVLQLGATMPIFDFGDIKREIGKADIERNLAQLNISVLFGKLHHEVGNAQAALSEAIAARKAAEDSWNLLSQREKGNQELGAAKLADPIALLEFKIRMAETKIDLTQLQMNTLKAATDYISAIGYDLSESLGVAGSIGSRNNEIKPPGLAR